MFYSVDRIEGEYAVLIDDCSHRTQVLLSELPQGTAEGSVLRKTENGYELDEAESERRREKLHRLSESLFGD